MRACIVPPEMLLLLSVRSAISKSVFFGAAISLKNNTKIKSKVLI